MVAWADQEALDATRETGLAHFHSRSRDRLWKKGESSGNTMAVESITPDCDGDTLLMRVHPAGPGLPHRRADLLRAATVRRHGRPCWPSWPP